VSLSREAIEVNWSRQTSTSPALPGFLFICRILRLRATTAIFARPYFYLMQFCRTRNIWCIAINSLFVHCNWHTRGLLQSTQGGSYPEKQFW